MILTISLFSCKKDSVDIKDTTAEISETNNDIYTVEEIRTLFNQKKPLDWKTEKDAKFIYSVGMHTDPIYSIGYKPKNITNLMEIIHLIDIHSDEWKNVENKVMNELLKNEGKKKNEVLIHHFDPLPSFVVQGLSLSTIEKLIAMDEVMYVEPKTTTIFAPGYSTVNLREDGSNNGLPYEEDVFESVTCGCGASPVIPADFPAITPDFERSWHFAHQGITDDSWNVSTGSGIGIAILDTGVSDYQENLYAYKFGYTWPYERLHFRYNFLPTINPSPDDEQVQSMEGTIDEVLAPNPAHTHDYCGHGTRMAGIATAPRGENGSAVGVAYGADLYSMRVAHNPILDLFTEKIAVCSALEEARVNDGIQVISMALGMALGATDTDIEMAIQMINNEGEKLIFCAAGTSPTWLGGNDVVFPANLITTLAITGMNEQLNFYTPLDGTDIRCDVCHHGSEVDFSVIMTRRNGLGNRNAVGINCTNDVPVYTTGSSAATATMAGIAALIWANEGVNTSAGTIKGKLLLHASNDDTNKHSTLGYGWINVESALGL
ncbi:MAG: S8 family serine peptidase [Saprospiraceae bacterium]